MKIWKNKQRELGKWKKNYNNWTINSKDLKTDRGSLWVLL